MNFEYNTNCAAKIYNNKYLHRPTLIGEESPIENVLREIALMFELKHRYLLEIFEVIEDEISNSLIIFLPWAGLGNVQSIFDNGNLSESMMCVCFHQMALALEYLHSKNVVHRDLKPENFLAFTETYFALSDFSVSTQLEDENQLLIDTKGSPVFMSPEECSGDSFLGKSADVWAYGISLYSMAFKHFPFGLDEPTSGNIANLIYLITNCLEKNELTFPSNDNTLLVDLLKKILQKDPKKRITFEQIVLHKYYDPARVVDEDNCREEE